MGRRLRVEGLDGVDWTGRWNLEEAEERSPEEGWEDLEVRV